jgi:hypothetical protein
MTETLFPGAGRKPRPPRLRVFHICPDPAIIVGELPHVFHETAVQFNNIGVLLSRSRHGLHDQNRGLTFSLNWFAVPSMQTTRFFPPGEGKHEQRILSPSPWRALSGKDELSVSGRGEGASSGEPAAIRLVGDAQKSEARTRTALHIVHTHCARPKVYIFHAIDINRLIGRQSAICGTSTVPR